MAQITYVDHLGKKKTIEVENGLTVMEGAIQNDIPGIDADCGGSMACATCHVYVDNEWYGKIPKAEEAEQVRGAGAGCGGLAEPLGSDYAKGVHSPQLLRPTRLLRL